MRRSNVLAIPFLALITLLVALPALAAVTLAFTNHSGVGASEFVGLENFRRLASDPLAAQAAENSLIFVTFSLPLRLIAMVGLALLLHARFVGAGAGRAAVYVPTVIPDVAFALLWSWVLNPLYGPFAPLFAERGFDLLTDPWGARLGLVLMAAFQIGEGFLIALAARRAIPVHLYEAAHLEGAGAWFVTRKVTLPLMLPAIALLAVRDLVLAFQVSFVPALLITDGGPRDSTLFVPLFIYRQAFRYFRLGYASAMSITMFVVTLIAILILYRIGRRYRYS